MSLINKKQVSGLSTDLNNRLVKTGDTVSGTITFNSSGSNTNGLLLKATGDTYGVSVLAPTTLTGDVTFKLPSANPSAGQVLKASNGNGDTEWGNVGTASGVVGKVQISDGSGGFTADTALHYNFATDRLGIGTTTPTHTVQIAGSFAAETKSFVIPHPTRIGKKLQHGALEGPEYGIYVRGEIKDKKTIELPDYWYQMVDPETITVQLTPIGKAQSLFVLKIEDNVVHIRGSHTPHFFYFITGERKDVDRMKVVF